MDFPTMARFAVTIFAFIFSALPLRRATKILKIKTKFSKILLIVFISGLAVSIIEAILKSYSGIIAIFLTLFIYKKLFKTTWPKASVLWLIELIVIIVSRIILALILDLIGIKTPPF